MREYAVVFERSGTGWSAYCPDLPGLASLGGTFEEVKVLMQQGLALHLEGMLDEGVAVPEPVTRVDTLQTDAVEAFQARLASQHKCR